MDQSQRSSLTWVYTVVENVSKTFQQTIKADDFCDDWRFKGQLITENGFNRCKLFHTLRTAITC